MFIYVSIYECVYVFVYPLKSFQIISSQINISIQVWHAPACKERYNACEWTILFADALGVKHSSPDPTKGVSVGTHDRDLPMEEIILENDDDSTKEKKKQLTKTREEKVRR